MLPSSPTDTICLSSRLNATELILREWPRTVCPRYSCTDGSNCNDHIRRSPEVPPVTTIRPLWDLGKQVKTNKYDSRKIGGLIIVKWMTNTFSQIQFFCFKSNTNLHGETQPFFFLFVNEHLHNRVVGLVVPDHHFLVLAHTHCVALGTAG